VREAQARVAAMNDLKQIAFAMLMYADTHGKGLPPAAHCDKDGRPLLSWRVLVLPYLEEMPLYKQFRLDEPWDSPHNLKLVARMPRVFDVPFDAKVPGHTFVQVFVGPGTAFEKRTNGDGWRCPEDFPDGSSNTILVAHAAKAVPWTKPADIVYDPNQPVPELGVVFPGISRLPLLGARSTHMKLVVMGDASVRQLPFDLTDATLRAAITRNDGKELGPDWE
jgi:uncharacterized protein DUF1559